MNQTDFEQVILCYLKEKGYKEAEQALERTLRVHEPDVMALSDRLSVHKGVVQHLLDSFATADQPAAYIEALDRFVNWLDNSLDMYRTELSRILYPLFVHTYLTLVAKDASAQANQLMSKFQKRVLQAEGGAARSRAAEVQELQSVAVKQHLATNNFVRQVRRSKYTVRLTQYAHGLLMHFLHTAPGMLCLASIVNQFVTIEVREGAETEELQHGAEEARDLASGEALTINAQPVQLGLLKDNIEDRYADLHEQRAQEADTGGPTAGGAGSEPAAVKAEAEGSAQGGAAAEGPAPASKKPKKTEASKPGAPGGQADGTQASSAPGARRLHPGDRIEPQPWTPQLSDQVTQLLLRDVEHRAAVGSSAPPSCCCFTFANTRQALNCAAFSSDVQYVAAGLADSSVRLYDVVKLAGAPIPPTRLNIPVSDAAKGAKGASSMDWDDGESTQAGVHYLYGHTGPVHSLDFSPDYRMLFSASGDGSVRAWSTHLATALTVYRGHLLPVWDVASGPLGYHFLTGSADRTARIWATDSVRMLRILTGHQSDVDVVGWHPNCHYALTASSDRSVRMWDVATGSCVRYMAGLQSAPTSMAVHPDGKHVAVGCERGNVHVWELGSGRRMTSFKAHVGPVWSLAYSKGEGTLLASGGADETVQVWSINGAMPPATGGTKTEEAAAPDTAPSHSKYTRVVAGHTKSSSVVQLQFSSCNLLLAAGAFSLRTKKKE